MWLNSLWDFPLVKLSLSIKTADNFRLKWSVVLKEFFKKELHNALVCVVTSPR